MYLQRLLQINMATLAALGAVLMGMGRRSPTVPLLVLLAAMLSIWLTDVTGWFRLSRLVGNLAALLATAVLLWSSGGRLEILAIANLLVCLQIILLFQQKDDWVYWLLAGVSLLQVVAATAFSQGFWFGLLLAVYMLVGLSALALLLLHRQWNRYRPAIKVPPPAGGDCRWPLTGQQSAFTGTPAGRARSGIRRELFARLARIGLGTVVLTVLLFLVLPRLGGSAWRGTLAGPTHVVGFSDEVTLGELGETIESNDEVMRIWFRDEAGNPYPARGEIYLHGTTLVEYSQGQWKAERSAFSGSRPRLKKADTLPAEGLVRLRCEIEPLDRDELFCIMPLVTTEANKEVIVDSERQRLTRVSYRRGRRFAYRLGTTALVDGVQKPLVPADETAPTGKVLQMPPVDGPQGLPNLVALAREWIAESGLPPDDRLGRARYLQWKLAASGQFQYSLEGQPRDPSIDAIEDFVTNNPKGHCEYFATALTLMLRSQQIPARMVVGYRCDEFNEPGNFYQVRQWHAHTWVEAYLPPDDLPAELLHGEDYWNWQSTGGWLRLDPTPAAGETEAGGVFAAILEPAKRAIDWLESVWADYVLEMDRRRQYEAIYQPVVQAVSAAIRKLGDPDWWRGLLDKVGWALDLTQGGAGFWVRLTLVFPACLLALLFGGRWLGRLVRRLWAWLAGRPTRAAGRDYPRVEFYFHLEALLAHHGLVRAAGQTQHEFAAVAGPEIAATTGRPDLASLPGEVVEAFYRVRFGRLPLDSPQAKAVEHALAELTTACSSIA